MAVWLNLYSGKAGGAMTAGDAELLRAILITAEGKWRGGELDVATGLIEIVYVLFDSDQALNSALRKRYQYKPRRRVPSHSLD